MKQNGCSPSGGRSEAEFATTQRKGLGTPAIRAAILKKLISAGFVERRKNEKTVSLIPACLSLPFCRNSSSLRFSPLSGRAS